jgi:site-specific recombinase XerD
LIDDLLRRSAQLTPTLHKAMRDRLILALGLACALRRTELVVLQVAGVQEGARATIRTFKTKQQTFTPVSTILPVVR